MSTKHTPTPWIAEGQQIVSEENGYRVAIVSSPHPRARGKERMEDLEYCQGNTAFIVRAVNSHEQLVAALREIESHLDGRMTHQADNPNYPFWNQLWDIASDALIAAGAA